MQGGVEEQRSRVQGEHREPGPGERLVPAEERLLPLGAEQAGAHPEPEPDGEGEEAEGDEAGGAGDVPGDGRLREEGVHRAAPETRMRGSSGSAPSECVSPVASTNSAPSSGCSARWLIASARLEMPSAVACPSASAGSGATTVTASGPREAGAPVVGVDQMVERARGAEAPCVAAGGRDAALLEPENAEGGAVAARIGDRDPPRPALGRRAPGGDVAAEIDDRAGHRGPGVAHRRERAGGREALPDAAEVDGGAALDPGAAGA